MSKKQVIDPLRAGTSDLSHRVDRSPNQEIVRNPLANVGNLKTGRREMDSISPCCKCKVCSAIHQYPAVRASGEGKDNADKIEQRAVFQILFADLNEIHTPIDRSADA